MSTTVKMSTAFRATLAVEACTGTGRCGNTYLLTSAARPYDTRRAIPSVDAHRIEKGFYEGFDVYNGDFRQPPLQPHEISYFDGCNAQWVARIVKPLMPLTRSLRVSGRVLGSRSA
jgi:hypothetical protein